MKNLVRLAVKYHAFLLFLALETLSFFLIYRSSSFRGDVLIASSNRMVGSLFEQRARLSEYLRLSETNARLAEENARLKVMDPMNYIALGREKEVFSDMLMHLRYEFIPAKVINNSFNKPNNYITLDAGSLHGIEPEMAVLGGGALVGIVKNVSDHFSTVLPAINVSFQTGVKMKRSKEPGLLTWNGQDPMILQVKNVPKHAKVAVGDTVLTSSASARFPENVLVGIVTRADVDPGASFYTIDIEATAAFPKLQYVEVVADKMKRELRELEAANP
jgi:rod shape-determining protein MreC